MQFLTSAIIFFESYLAWMHGLTLQTLFQNNILIHPSTPFVHLCLQSSSFVIFDSNSSMKLQKMCFCSNLRCCTIIRIKNYFQATTSCSVFLWNKMNTFPETKGLIVWRLSLLGWNFSPCTWDENIFDYIGGFNESQSQLPDNFLEVLRNQKYVQMYICQ